MLYSVSLAATSAASITDYNFVLQTIPAVSTHVINLVDDDSGNVK